jgi:ABC-type Fe3+/spermidine/putrescine transport system ATPase subunit
LITIRGLGIQLGAFSFRNLELSIPDGEYLVLLGPTGVGKTVLVETLAGLQRPIAGRILLDGVDVTALPPEARGMGFVPQDYALFPHLSVHENIAFGLQTRGQDRQQQAARVRDIANRLGIATLLDRSVGRLSGGERQRVALARALVIAPKVLILDEPTSAVDPTTRRELWAELHRVKREFRVTTLHITHDFEEAIALADRVAIFLDGQISQEGPPDQVFRRPSSRAVANFLGIRNVFPAQISSVRKDALTLAWGPYELGACAPEWAREGQSVWGCIRAEDVMILRPDMPLRPSVKENMVSGRIVAEVPGESMRTLWLEMAQSDGFSSFRLEIRIPNHAYQRMGLHLERECRVSLKESALHLLRE